MPDLKGDFRLRTLRTHWAALLFLGAVFLLGASRWEIDPPVGVSTWSQGIALDPSQYSKWPRNLVNFGIFTYEKDYVAIMFAPLHNLLLVPVFYLFGAGAQTLQLYSLGTSLAGLGLFYFLLQRLFSLRLAFMGLLMTVASINFAGVARAGMAENIAVLCSLMAGAVYVSASPGPGGAFLSTALAGAAILGKWHFAGVAAAVGGLHLLDAWREGEGVKDGRCLGALTAGLLFFCIVGLLYAIFPEETSFIWNVQGPKFSGGASTGAAARAMRTMANFFPGTRHLAFFLALPLAGVSLLGASTRAAVRTRLRAGPDESRRADAFFAGWLILTLASYAVVFDYTAPRYFHFALFPMTYLTLRAASALREAQRAAWVAAVLTAAQVAFHVPYFNAWLSRRPVDSFHRAYSRMAGELKPEREGPIGVLGTHAALLGMYDARVRAFDLCCVPPEYSLCDRLEFHRPEYFIAESARQTAMVEACPGVEVSGPVMRASVNSGREGEVELRRLSYPSEE